MKKYLGLLILTIGWTLAAVPALATPVVVQGSVYSFQLEGSQSGNAFTGNTVFDSQTGTAQRGNMTISASESETVLNNTQSRITINISGTGDLFPVFNESAYLGIGTDGNGLDLMSAVSLDNVTVSFLDSGSNVLFSFDGLQNYAGQPNPWDGIFPMIGNSLSFDEVGGMGVTGITFDFLVTQSPTSADVPEPDTGILLLIGMIASFASARYHRSRA